MRMHADIEIDRSADDVFAYISNFENNPLWQRGMKEARYITDPPLAEGSQYEQVAGFLGRPVVTRFEGFPAGPQHHDRVDREHIPDRSHSPCRAAR